MAIAQAHLRSGRPAMYSRRGHDWTRRFQPIAEALAALSAKDLVLDGEGIVRDPRGIPGTADLAGGRKDRLLDYRDDPDIQYRANESTKFLGEPRGSRCWSRPGTFCKPPTRLQRL
jgi:hypothetical protein